MAVHPRTPLDRGRLVSPELVLVDPVLRRRLLAQAQEEARTEAEPTGTRAPAAARPVARVDDAQADRAVPAPVPVDSRRRRVSLGVVVVACAVAFVLGAKLAGPSYVAPPRDVPEAAAAQAPPLPTPGRTLPRGTERLTWTPVRQAVGYEVAVYSQKGRVFSAQTLTPGVDLPPSVRHAGGRLTWYVWPVRAGAGGSPGAAR
jgi:hypothetical protein